MRIIRTHLWKHPQVILTILNPLNKLDPLVILSNAELFILVDKNIVGFAAVKHYNSKIREIKSVYTYPQYRSKGYAKKLISHVSKRYPNIYLVCRAPLVTYYEKLGFKQALKSPKQISSKVKLWNLFFGSFHSLQALILKKN